MKVWGIRYIKYFLRIARLEILTSLQYPADFIITILGQVVWTLLYLVFIEVIFSQFQEVIGYSRSEMFFIFGITHLNYSIISVYLHNLQVIASNAVDGGLDRHLIKPLNPIFSMATDSFDPYVFFNIFISLVIITYASANISITVSISSILILILLEVLLFTVFICLNITMMSLSFWIGNVEIAYWNFDSLSDISKYPVDIFKGSLKVLFQRVLPFGLYGALQAMLFFGKFDYNLLPILILITIIWFIIARVTWSYGLRRYSSASQVNVLNIR